MISEKEKERKRSNQISRAIFFRDNFIFSLIFAFILIPYTTSASASDLLNWELTVFGVEQEFKCFSFFSLLGTYGPFFFFLSYLGVTEAWKAFGAFLVFTLLSLVDPVYTDHLTLVIYG